MSGKLHHSPVVDRINVVDLGATPSLDYPSDEAFAAAIAWPTPEGCEIVVPPGNYLLTRPLDIKGRPAVSLRGLGRPTLNFRLPPGTPGPAIRITESTALLLSRLNLLCEEGTTCGIEATRSHFMRLEGIVIHGPGLASTAGCCLHLDDCYNGTVVNCVFDAPRGARSTVHHGPHCNQWLYQACKIIQKSGVGLDLIGGFSVQIHACDLSGPGIGAKVHSARSVTFQGLYAENCRVGVMTGKYGEVVVRDSYFNLERPKTETETEANTDRRRIGVLARGSMATVESSFFLGSHAIAEPESKVVSTAVVIRDLAHEASRQIHVLPNNTYQGIYPVVELMDADAQHVPRRIHVGSKWAAKDVGNWPPEVRVPGGGVKAVLMLARYSQGPERTQTWMTLDTQADVPPEMQQQAAFPDEDPTNDGWPDPLDLS